MDARPTPRPGRTDSVRSIARAAGRRCSRPGCTTPAAATLVMAYASQETRLIELLEESDPQAYDLCDPHAARTTPPRGWELVDDRPVRPVTPARSLDDEDGTVALLAAALRDDPLDGPAAPGADVDAAPEVDLHDEEEDPLRAALEEVQRVVDPDPSVPGADPTPLRRRRVVITHPDDPDDEPTLW